MEAGKACRRDVCLVIDELSTNRKLFNLLNAHFDSCLVVIGNHANVPADEARLYVFVVDLTRTHSVAVAKSLLGVLNARRVPSLFILDEFDRRKVVQLYAIGGSEFLVRAAPATQLVGKVRALMNDFVEARWSELRPVQQAALRSSLGIFQKLEQGRPAQAVLTPAEVSEACRMVVQATAGESLQSWVSQLKLHHNYTYRHSMMVTAFLTGFAHSVGFSGKDIEKLALGGLLHDIGKLAVPLSILDKPSKLDESEWQVMRRHPEYGMQAIRGGAREWGEDIVDCILHHHERLDGSGYPDGLRDGEISDIVRLISIADTFSALIDKRAYKQPLDPMDAFQVLLRAEGQLERKLVEAFEPLALALTKPAPREAGATGEPS
jgi:putative nucleotidyltransferase with HDIG domain